MTLTSALYSARTGLSTTQTQIAASSDNIANALTEGYVARSSDAISRTIGGQSGGVQTQIIRGPVDSRLLRDLRFAGADAATAQTLVDLLALAVNTAGIDGTGSSFSSRMNDLQLAFQALADAPNNPSAQRNVLNAAADLAQEFSAREVDVRVAREEADAAIGRDVAQANDHLQRLEELNDEIISAAATGVDPAGLKDERDQRLNALSGLIGIRTFESGDGDVIVTTKEGITLLDGDARLLEFTPVAQVAPGATLGAPLSALTVDGTDVTPGSGAPQSAASGSIAGGFIARDVELPRFQSQLDELARQTLDAFQTADASVVAAGPGATGLFVELDAVTSLPIAHNAGVPADPVPGLAGRLAINPLVDPSAGGTLARLRDGVQPAAPGAAGDTAQVNQFIAAFDAQRSFSAITGLGGQNTLTGFATDMIASQDADRVDVLQQAEARSAAYTTLVSRQVGETGVNVDAESERLLTLEQAYAANAQVISVVNRMFDELLARLS